MIKKPILYFCNHTVNLPVNTGIQRTVRLLAKALIDIGEKLVPVGYNHDTGKLYILDNKDLVTFSNFNGPGPDKWERQYTLDHYFALNCYALIPELYNFKMNVTSELFNSLGSIRKYVIYYDSVPIVLSSIYNQGWNERHLNYLQQTKSANGVISISKSSTDDYIKIAGAEGLNIKTIPLPNQFIVDMPYVPEKENNSKDIEILTVSTIEGRKNHKLLIRAFLQAQQELQLEGYNLKLNLVGHSGPEWKEHSDFVLYAAQTGFVKWYQNASDEKLLELYKNADFTIYPSIYEGYGLPIVESLSFNTPCISSNSSSMKEIAEKGGCLLFDPNDQEDLKKKIIYLSKNKEIRHELVNEIKYIPEYTWTDYAKKILSFIENGE